LSFAGDTLPVLNDIDASEVIANKANAQWTYKKHKGYMPIIGHIAQTNSLWGWHALIGD
jgi:hypothetical protein